MRAYDQSVRKTLLIGVVLATVVAASAEAAGSRFVSFRTPSGNIHCLYVDDPHYLRCDIRSGLRPRPRTPPNCDLEYGDSISMRRTGRPGLVCHGDTAVDPRSRVLRYGTTLRVGPFACTSRFTGLTCRNAARHGFFLSRENYRLF
jgi:hypothetical protein